MRARVLWICAALLLTAGTARAQLPEQDPIGQSFFAPELVMQHQEAIGLSAEQKDYLKTEIRQAQLKFTEWQWKLQDEMEKMVALVKQPRADEQQRYAASDVLHLHALRARLDTMLVREHRTELARSCFEFLPARALLDLEGWAEQDIFAH